MALKHSGYIELPSHVKQGGFDHAAVHRASSHLYIAHTANDSLDVIDCAGDTYMHSIPNLTGVAGALVSDERDLVFTSNRGENTIGIFPTRDEQNIAKVQVGIRPNGLAFDPNHNLLLAANVGDPDIPGSFTVSVVDIEKQTMVASIPVTGRTRWTVYDANANLFYVNIARPAQIVVIDANNSTCVAHIIEIPAAGPHGLEHDTVRGRLFCACDEGKLVVVDTRTGKAQESAKLSGVPDVIFSNPTLHHLYVAIGDPGVIDVFDTETMTRLESISTEKGAHTIAFDATRNKVYAFLPETHRAAVYLDCV